MRGTMTDWPSVMMRFHMSPLVFLTRLAWLMILTVTMVFIFYSSANVSPDMDMYGGLAGCITCANGWNWHVLLMTFAFPVAMVEGLLILLDPTGVENRHGPNLFSVSR